MMNDYWFNEVTKTRAAELADIAAMDRLARDLAPASSLRRHAWRLGYGGLLSTLSRWSQRRRHVSHAR